ncbi:hypothetical protein BDY21DRAFT_102381 [Lineolata rhizophorae]|uniref:Uncharacterized protein n=1 Tax=Lineolata rhizophorae TaxID=578093 RepID=A0A6A6NSR2_9PEZI|nr:hypothetical protein BDY21DRAFT_102381 [Lineolata rhizophorae]
MSKKCEEESEVDRPVFRNSGEKASFRMLRKHSGSHFIPTFLKPGRTFPGHSRTPLVSRASPSKQRALSMVSSTRNCHSHDSAPAPVLEADLGVLWWRCSETIKSLNILHVALTTPRRAANSKHRHTHTRARARAKRLEKQDLTKIWRIRKANRRRQIATSEQ